MPLILSCLVKLVLQLLGKSLGGGKPRHAVLPLAFDSGRDESNHGVVEDVEDFVTALNLVMDARLEVVDAHFAHVGQRRELFRFKCSLMVVELLLREPLARYGTILVHLIQLGLLRCLLIGSMTTVLSSLLRQRVQLYLTLQGI